MTDLNINPDPAYMGNTAPCEFVWQTSERCASHGAYHACTRAHQGHDTPHKCECSVTK